MQPEEDARERGGDGEDHYAAHRGIAQAGEVEDGAEDPRENEERSGGCEAQGDVPSVFLPEGGGQGLHIGLSHPSLPPLIFSR